MRPASEPHDRDLSARWQAKLTELTPVRGNDEKHTRDGKRNSCDDPSCVASLQPRDFSGDKPYTGEQDQQESDFREGDARLMTDRSSKHRFHDSSVAPDGQRWLAV